MDTKNLHLKVATLPSTNLAQRINVAMHLFGHINLKEFKFAGLDYNATTKALKLDDKSIVKAGWVAIYDTQGKGKSTKYATTFNYYFVTQTKEQELKNVVTISSAARYGLPSTKNLNGKAIKDFSLVKKVLVKNQLNKLNKLKSQPVGNLTKKDIEFLTTHAIKYSY